MFNINPEIVQLAESMGLECIATGGGIDYVFKHFDNGMEAIITDREDAGSPDDLTSPCDLIIYMDNNWESWFTLRFRSTSSAIMALAFIESTLNWE